MVPGGDCCSRLDWDHHNVICTVKLELNISVVCWISLLDLMCQVEVGIEIIHKEMTPQHSFFKGT